LLCSAYKFFGPHVGMMYGRRSVTEKLRPLKLRPQEDFPPYKFETGTLNHEGIAGTLAAIDFIADMGAHHAELVAQYAPDRLAGLSGRRRDIVAGMLATEAFEQPLAQRLIDGLSAIPGLRIYGPPDGHPRTSTVSFTLGDWNAQEIARRLADQGLFVWDGDFFATRLVEKAGLVERGGLVRIGLAPYSTPDEVERVIVAVAALAQPSASA
jgi:selenocysteine lyase/cysteine desulfurase